MWRPFLEESPEKTLPFLPIIYNAIWLFTNDNSEINRQKYSIEEEELNRTTARALKLLSHFAQSEELFLQYIILSSPLNTNENIEFFEISQKLYPHSSSNLWIFNSVLKCASKTISDENIRTSAIFSLCSFTKHQIFYELFNFLPLSSTQLLPLLNFPSQSNSTSFSTILSFNFSNFLDDVMKSSIELLEDESIQVLDRIVELLSSILTSPPLVNPHHYSLWSSLLLSRYPLLFLLLQFNFDNNNDNNDNININDINKNNSGDNNNINNSEMFNNDVNIYNDINFKNDINNNKNIENKLNLKIKNSDQVKLTIINLIYRLSCKSSSKVEKNSGVLLPLKTWNENENSSLLSLFHSRGHLLLHRFQIVKFYSKFFIIIYDINNNNNYYHF